jgi:glycosyltransferase involved in cell wall biosynthesis
MDKINLNYIIITPAHNEEDFIENTIKSVICQTVKPEKWVIVSDGSTDRTDEIIKSYLKEYDWIEYVRLPEHRDRQFAAKVTAFNSGYDKIKNFNYQIIGNLDADITFDSDYFEFLLGKFYEFPELGVAGTPFVEGNVRISSHDLSDLRHVSGACQMFRKECFEEIGGYIPIRGGGIDWTAVTTARMKGWRTQTFTEKVCHHHRKIGTGRKNSVLISRFNYGQKEYFLGNHPIWEILRVIFLLKNKPYVIGSIFTFAGYVWETIRHKKRPISDELVKFHRMEQMERLKGFFVRKK